MTTIRPKPGDWIHLRAKVIETPAPELVLVELFSKTDQYRAWIRGDLVVAVVDAPVPYEPPDGAVVMVLDRVYQRIGDQWYRAGAKDGQPWRALCSTGEIAYLP